MRIIRFRTRFRIRYLTASAIPHPTRMPCPCPCLLALCTCWLYMLDVLTVANMPDNGALSLVQPFRIASASSAPGIQQRANAAAAAASTRMSADQSFYRPGLACDL